MALERDSQINTRFPFFMTLPRWEDGDGWRDFLDQFEATLPLRYASNLYADDRMAKYLLDRSEGILGIAVLLLQCAAIDAMRCGDERITLDLLKQVSFQN
jgi:hypothetical protein